MNQSEASFDIAVEHRRSTQVLESCAAGEILFGGIDDVADEIQRAIERSDRLCKVAVDLVQASELVVGAEFPEGFLRFERRVERDLCVENPALHVILKTVLVGQCVGREKG